MKKYFSALLQFLNQIRVRCSSRFNRLQRVTTVAALTTALILFAHQAYAFDILDELDNCFSGGCDPTRPEVVQSVTERVEEVRETIESVNWEELVEYYNNPSSAYRALWREIANVADTALNGVISRNFGHVTNKSELRRALESQGIVIYGLEISHDEYYTATTYAAASVVSENPAPLIYYFKDLAYRSYSEMLLNLNRAIEEAPERLQGQYAAELQQLEEALSIEYIATALASYVSTGEVPDISFDIDLSTVDIRFGVLTYSRGERTPAGTIVTPNTHQPYIIVTPPGLGVRIAQTIEDYTVPQEDITSFGATQRNFLSIRPFDGQTFGEVSSSQTISGADRYRGWSWDGATASYVAFENGQSTLIARPFDGRTFGSVSSSQVVSSTDRFRGWSWDGTTASYVAVDENGRSTLYIRPFNGQTLGSVSSTQAVSSTDRFRGWSWYSNRASYVSAS